MTKSYKILIVDPNSLSREGLKRALPNRVFSVCGSWPSLDEALELISPDCDCNAVLVNLSQQPLPQQGTLNQLRQLLPEARIALIGEAEDYDRVQQATRLKFDGYLLESISIDAIPKAIELILLGVRVFPVLSLGQKEPVEDPALPSPAATTLDSLSTTELRVLALLAKAKANKVIARDLNISESTVKVHVKAILRKTGSKNRTDAALLVRDIGARSYFQHLAKTIDDDSAARLPPS